MDEWSATPAQGDETGARDDGERARRGDHLDRRAEDDAAETARQVTLIEVEMVQAGIDQRGDALRVCGGEGEVEALVHVSEPDAVDVDAVGVGATAAEAGPPVAEDLVRAALEGDGRAGDCRGVHPEWHGIKRRARRAVDARHPEVDPTGERIRQRRDRAAHPRTRVHDDCGGSGGGRGKVRSSERRCGDGARWIPPRVVSNGVVEHPGCARRAAALSAAHGDDLQAERGAGVASDRQSRAARRREPTLPIQIPDHVNLLFYGSGAPAPVESCRVE